MLQVNLENHNIMMYKRIFILSFAKKNILQRYYIFSFIRIPSER